MSNLQILPTLLLLLLFASCKEATQTHYEIADPLVSDPILIHPDSIKIEDNPGAFSVDKTVKQESQGVQLITFYFKADQPSELQPITIRFNFPSVDINGYWNPRIAIDKVNYYYSAVSSKASNNAPILAFYNSNLENRITMALSDALNQSEMRCYLKEEDVKFYPQIKLFGERMPKTTSYQITLRIDTRSVPYYEAIDDVATWWADRTEYKPMQVPEAAKEPMYSTWYSYHQSISAEKIVKECEIARSLGCGAVIIDDGWQTNDGNRGYAYTGDWLPDRIPDMKGFVDSVHNQGMKFLLWYSLPFIGEKAKNFPRFKGKYLHHWKSQGTYVLDPRYPEVREFIINTYIQAIEDWNLDGFKLDFIARFKAYDDTQLTKTNGRDFASVNEATDFLMTEITNRLTAVKPDILIEFRQPYIGPLMRKYGNMFRGVDCANNAVANRNEITNLRILSQETAVHSDMFIWRKEETVEQAALQILNILYSVPQLSVRLEDIPEDHLDMIRYWFSYWNENKAVLMDGDFIPSSPVTNYPSLTARKDGHQITTLYEDVIVAVHDFKRLDLINAKASTKIHVQINAPFKGKLEVKDCMGKIVAQKEVSLDTGVHTLTVPRSGTATYYYVDW